MFKVPKHKQRRPFRGSKNVSDDNDNKEKKRHRIPMVTSFAYDDDDDDLKNPKKEMNKKKKKKKSKKSQSKKTGMGFGGGSMSFLQEEEEEDMSKTMSYARKPMGVMMDDNNDPFHEEDNTFLPTDDDDGKNQSSMTHNLYDKSAMEQLKLQQKIYTRRPVNDETTDKDPTVSTTTTVISGEEAIAHMIHESQQNTNDRTNDNASSPTIIESPTPVLEKEFKNNHTKVNDEDDEASKRQWEEQVARRAGVPISSTTENVTSSSHPPPSQKKDSDELMEDIQSSIQQTLTQLRSTKQICQSKLRQQQVEEQQWKHRQNQNINPDELGAQLEYYQKLRLQLVSWIGALRYIQSDILYPTIQAMHQYYHTHHSPINNTTYMTKTIIPILQKMDIVQSFIYPPHRIKPLVVSVNTQKQQKQQQHHQVQQLDEFGRDITSIQQRKKDKYKQERKHILQQSRHRRTRNSADHRVTLWDLVQDDYKDEDMECSDFDILQRQENRILLTDAVQLALNSNLETQYYDIPSLLEVFQQWHQHHTSPHTNDNDTNYYESCYATMSLADLLSVLVQIQLCQYWDLNATPNTNQRSNNNTLLTFSVQDMTWYKHIKSFELVESRGEKQESKTQSNQKNTELSESHNIGSSSSLLFQIICKKAIAPWLDFFFQCTHTDENDHSNPSQDEEKLWAYNPFSSTHTRSLSSLLSVLRLHNMTSCPNNAVHDGQTDDSKKEQDKKFFLQLQENLVNYLSYYLQNNVCIPILKLKNTTTIKLLNKIALLTEAETTEDIDINEEQLEAFTYAAIGTVTLMEKLILNILTYWYPLIDDATQKKRLAKWILSDIFTHRILPTLNLWREMDSNPNNIMMNDQDKSTGFTGNGSDNINKDSHGKVRAFAILNSIVKPIQLSGMLDDEDLMLHAAPLRVAAAMYNIEIS